MTASEATLRFESCTSTWIFDTRHMRFRRILKGLGLTPRSATWRRYYGLELDERSESFAVVLNPERTRWLRSWRHISRCQECGSEPDVGHGSDGLGQALAG